MAKGAKFSSEKAKGISWASFGGGTNIFIQGVGLAENPQSNTVMLTSEDIKGDNGPMRFVAPKLTEDDAFLSQPQAGFIVYRLPAVHELIQSPMGSLDQFKSMKFKLMVFAVGPNGAEELECKSENNCRISFERSYTPIMHYISPPVVYYDSLTSFVFDPKSTTHVIQDLRSDELPFINAKIGNDKKKALVDFEFNMDYNTGLNHWRYNSIQGRVGDQPPSKS